MREILVAMSALYVLGFGLLAGWAWGSAIPLVFWSFIGVVVLAIVTGVAVWYSDR